MLRTNIADVLTIGANIYVLHMYIGSTIVCLFVKTCCCQFVVRILLLSYNWWTGSNIFYWVYLLWHFYSCMLSCTNFVFFVFLRWDHQFNEIINQLKSLLLLHMIMYYFWKNQSWMTPLFCNRIFKNSIRGFMPMSKAEDATLCLQSI